MGNDAAVSTKFRGTVTNNQQNTQHNNCSPSTDVTHLHDRLPASPPHTHTQAREAERKQPNFFWVLSVAFRAQDQGFSLNLKVKKLYRAT